jgi:PAS domain S-box-containing protein
MHAVATAVPADLLPLANVLIVDDRESNLFALHAILESLGVRIVQASSGREALKFLLTPSGDECALILLDVQMPGLDGFETADLIRQRDKARSRSTPIIFVTAIAREEANIVKGYASGGIDYVVKPFDPEILLAKTRFFLAQYERERKLARAAAQKMAEAGRKLAEGGERERELIAAADATRAGAKARKEYVELLAEAIPQLAWIADADGSIYWFNQRWYEYTGADIDAMVGWGWTLSLHQADRGRVVEHYKATLASAEVWEDTFQLRGKDGGYRWFLTRALALRDEQGQVTRWFGTNTDVTQQRENELALETVSQRKTDFIGILSHELRNPLGPIRTSLAVLVHQQKDPSRTADAVSVIARQVDHLGGLVDDLLDVTRISHGRIVLKRTSVDLAAVAATAAADYRFLFQGRGIGLELELPKRPVWVDVDPLRATQVVGNLLHNAARFTPAGGRVALEVKAEPTPELRVRDTGIGLEAELLARIFEPFNQTPRSRAYTQGGLGIGLSIVKNLVELQGGRVDARSGGVDQGLEILISLPPASEPAPIDTPKRGPLAMAQRRQILLIEDNRDAVEALSTLLEMDGHSVRTAFDGEAGVREAIAQPPEIIICDLGLPLLDGHGVARALRRRPELAETTLVALSGYAQAHDREQARAAGFEFHLAKPADLEELREIIAAAS